MHIATLEARGMARDFSHSLTPAVLFTGLNMVGKSTRLRAIRFALLGYDPILGKTNEALWQLSNGVGPMRVGLTFDNMSVIQRSLTRKPDGGVSADVQRLGNGLPEGPMPMLDPESYFGLTDNERINYIFGLMKMPDAYTVEAIVADVRNIQFADNTDYTEKARNMVADTVKIALENHGIANGLTELTKEKGYLRGLFSGYNKRAKDTQGTMRVLSELKTRAGEASAETIQSLGATLSVRRGQLDKANRTAGELTARQMEANRVGLRRRQLEEALSVPSSINPAAIETLELENAKIEKKIKSKFKIADVQDLGRVVRDAIAEADEADRELKGVDSRIAHIDEELSELAQAKSCPHCKSRGTGWKKNLRETYTKEREHLAKSKDLIQARVRAADKRRKAADKEHAKAVAAVNADNEIREQMLTNEQEAGRLRSRLGSESATRTAQREELTNLATILPPTDEELSASAAAIQKLSDEIAQIDRRYTDAVALQQDLLRAAEAAAEHQEAAAMVEAIKLAGAALKSRQGDMIAVLFATLLETANYFAHGILKAPLVFSNGAIGYYSGSQFVSHKTFSGTEKAIAYIAITAALMKDAPLRIVLLDEFDIDAEILPRVLQRLEQATRENVIDQVVVAHTTAPAGLSGWQEIKLTRE